jgi:hypothetical protein
MPGPVLHVMWAFISLVVNDMYYVLCEWYLTTTTQPQRPHIIVILHLLSRPVVLPIADKFNSESNIINQESFAL